jgi:hypothetical protein
MMNVVMLSVVAPWLCQQNISSRNFFSAKRCGWKYLPTGITHLFIASLTIKKFSAIEQTYNKRERLRTDDLLIKGARFVKRVNNVFNIKSSLS